MDIVATLVMLLLYVVVLVVVFLIMRALWLWYFRVNEIVDALQEAVHKLAMIETALSKDKPQASIISQPHFTGYETYSPNVAAKPPSLTVQNRQFYSGKPFKNETSEFRSIQWETPISDIPLTLNQVSSSKINGHKIDTYSNPSESLIWHDLALETANYGFVDDRLLWGMLRIDPENSGLVIYKLIEVFGPSDMQERGISYWLGRNTIIAFDSLFGYGGKVATILFMSKRAYTSDDLDIVNSVFPK